MKKIIYLLSAIIVIVVVLLFKGKISSSEKEEKFINGMPRPEEGEDNARLRALYNTLRHKTAGGVSWEQIEAQNAVVAAEQRANQGLNSNFANGQINGVWEERGAQNQAGSVRAIDYVAATNTLYTIGNGGSLWSSVLGSGNWTLRNQQHLFEQRCIKAFTKLSGGTRLLLATNLNVYYSDDEGATIAASTGINFPVAWGGNFIAGIYKLNDASNTIYCLIRCWSNSPWAQRYRLYMSTNEGQSFTQIFQFDSGGENTISLCVPHNSNNVYVADVGSLANNVKMYNVSGSTVNLFNTFNLGVASTDGILKGTYVASTYTMYLLHNNNKIYQSTNLGASWTLQSNLAENAWDKMNVSMTDPLSVSYGGVNAYRSSNGGTSFVKINDWSDYYSNVVGKLHADIMEIEYFKRTDNSEFCIVNSHGGTYLSNDKLLTVSNQSLTSHRAVEYYDVLSDTINQNRIFAGSQDQGLQRTITGLNAGPQNFRQDISGDYGQMALTFNNTFLWSQYPGGAFYRFTNLGNVASSYIGAWTVAGTQKPNYGWMLATTSTTSPVANEIFVGGGNMSGGGGSYLIKASALSVSPYTVSYNQYAYDFRANSRTATAGITAIEQSPVNSNKLYVATEDGTFFYSNDAGANWTKNNSFNGPTPWYLYGSCILASKINENQIWYCGSGYSNPPVYVSTDNGASFTVISNGLPPTLVNEMVATPDEKFIFAATEAGPYVYVVAENLWYPLADNSLPVQFFSSVEFLRQQNIVRFGTMGRGIWDFKITSIVPVTLKQWSVRKLNNNQALCSWSTSQEINTSHFIIERSTDAVQFSQIGSLPANGASNGATYSFTDKSPAKGMNYYRLVSVDADAKKQLSAIEAVNFDHEVSWVKLYPNPVKQTLYVELPQFKDEVAQITITNMAGNTVLKKTQTVSGNVVLTVNVGMLPSSAYIIQIKGKNSSVFARFIKQ